MKCNFCEYDLELMTVDIDRSQHSHSGTATTHYKCDNCGSELFEYSTGQYRKGATKDRPIRYEEVIPDGYMTVVNHEDRIVYSGDKTEDELNRAIKQCKSSCPPSQKWYIIEGKVKYDVWEDELKSNVDSVAKYRINPE